jgi:hypothetical protein
MDNDFPTVMSGNDFLTSYLKKYGGGEQYSQTGTDIPTFSVGRDFAGGEGTGIPPYFNEEVTASPGFGGQYQNLGEIAEAPQYIRIPPDLDSPAADRWLQEHPGTGTRQTAPQDFLRNKPLMQQKYRGIGAFPA